MLENELESIFSSEKSGILKEISKDDQLGSNSQNKVWIEPFTSLVYRTFYKIERFNGIKICRLKIIIVLLGRIWKLQRQKCK